MNSEINPWSELPNGTPFVPSVEVSVIESHNDQINSDTHRLRLDVLPEPFIGNIDASVYLLNLNPGYCSEDLKWHARDDFASAIRANLVHEASEYPFYFLNPEFSESGGSEWWCKKLAPLIKATSQKRVAKSVFCVEYLGYHSIKYQKIAPKIAGGYLPTQLYAAQLVRQAMEEDKVVVLMRSRAQWFGLVPELALYKKL
jgi:hypothetical protein